MDFFKAFPLLLWKQVTQQFKEKPPRFCLVNESGGMLLKHTNPAKCSVLQNSSHHLWIMKNYGNSILHHPCKNITFSKILLKKPKSFNILELYYN
jgi:hypothetical protein